MNPSSIRCGRVARRTLLTLLSIAALQAHGAGTTTPRPVPGLPGPHALGCLLVGPEIPTLPLRSIYIVNVSGVTVPGGNSVRWSLTGPAPSAGVFELPHALAPGQRIGIGVLAPAGSTCEARGW